MAKNTSGRGERDLKVKVKTARGRKLSSTLWLQRQLNDPYVRRAKAEGYRGRAAFKILELDDRFRFLVPGARVVDLGCAPGGWCQVAVRRVNALGEKKGKPVGRVIGIDLQEVEPIAGLSAGLVPHRQWPLRHWFQPGRWNSWFDRWRRRNCSGHANTTPHHQPGRR